MKTLFHGEEVIARYVPGRRRDAIVVTFDSYTDNPKFDRPGFGEAVFAAAGVPAIHVISRANGWYQHDEMADLLASVAQITKPFVRVLAYGSSMGGYAAIRFADAVGANRVLALSPQYSVDPTKVPWERRWEEAARLSFRERERIACKARPVVVYDPRNDDRRHADLIGGDIAIERCPLPFSGHPAGTMLAEVGAIRQIALRMLDYDPQPRPLVRMARRRRRACPTYLLSLARSQPPHRPKARSSIARLIGSASSNADACAFVAGLLREADDHDGALAMFERAAGLCGRPPHILLDWSDACAVAGRMDQAAALAIEVAEASPHIAYRQHWAAHILNLKGDKMAAVRFSRASRQIEPDNELYQWMERQLNVPAHALGDACSAII